jgi:hypothetical protein
VTQSETPPLVLKLCRALVALTGDRGTIYWVSIDRCGNGSTSCAVIDLRLPDHDRRLGRIVVNSEANR